MARAHTDTFHTRFLGDVVATPIATGVDRIVDIGVVTNSPPTFFFLMERTTSYQPGMLHVIQAAEGTWRALPVELRPDPHWDEAQANLDEELASHR